MVSLCEAEVCAYGMLCGWEGIDSLSQVGEPATVVSLDELGRA